MKIQSLLLLCSFAISIKCLDEIQTPQEETKTVKVETSIEQENN